MKVLKEKMARYSDYQYDETKPMDQNMIDSIPWTKFKIIVPTERDKLQVQKAIEYLHNCDIDTDYVWVNQIVHAYETDENYEAIVVNSDIFNSLKLEH